MTIRVGTRGSALALAQARTTAAALERVSGEPCELVVVRTEGDTSSAPLAAIGGTGVFAGALRAALSAGTCDVVVHSLKDLPVQPAPGLVVAAIPEREDARDALCAVGGGTLDSLPAGATVGTGSPRRRAQVADRRPDLRIVDIRGNVDTRLGRVASGDLDAVVLAAAGLGRLGRTDRITELLPLASWPTAPGQGALGIEIREEDATGAGGPSAVGRAVAALSVAEAWDSATAERIVLAVLEAGCAAPIGVASESTATSARIWATVHRPGGGLRIDRERSVDFAPAERGRVLAAAARDLAADLLEAGAADLAPLGASA